jgi:hypothetical protein
MGLAGCGADGARTDGVVPVWTNRVMDEVEALHDCIRDLEASSIDLLYRKGFDFQARFGYCPADQGRHLVKCHERLSRPIDTDRAKELMLKSPGMGYARGSKPAPRTANAALGLATDQDGRSPGASRVRLVMAVVTLWVLSVDGYAEADIPACALPFLPQYFPYRVRPQATSRPPAHQLPLARHVDHSGRLLRGDQLPFGDLVPQP